MSRSLESFVPRRTFTVPQPHSFTWFPGHMLTGLRSLASTISDIDLIIETRDARIPLSSRNPYLYDVCGNKRRLVLYNKHDLAGLSRRETEMILSWHTRPEEVVFTNVPNQHDIRRLVYKMRDVAEELNRPEGMKSIIIGMPNTGKSTMLNVIRNIATERKGNAAKSSAEAGLTRSISSIIKVIDDPPVYMRDSPGLMMPFIPTRETFLALALCGSVPDKIVPPPILADFLLYHLNLINPKTYARAYDMDPTNDVDEFLWGIAERMGLIHKGGHVDEFSSALDAIRRFRKGAFGAWPVDRIAEDSFMMRIREEVTAKKRELRGGDNIFEDTDLRGGRGVNAKEPRSPKLGTMGRAIAKGRRDADPTKFRIKKTRGPARTPPGYRRTAEGKRAGKKATKKAEKKQVLNRNKGAKSKKKKK